MFDVMPGFETVDSLEIDAPAQTLFDVVLDYPHMRDWYHRYEVDVIGGGDVVEGAQLQHVLAARGSPVKSRFTRTIQRVSPPTEIEEVYDGGDLVGKGRWVFEPLGDDRTKVSFRCDVRSNSLLMHIGFLLGGERGHNMVYQELLAALADHVAKTT